MRNLPRILNLLVFLSVLICVELIARRLPDSYYEADNLFERLFTNPVGLSTRVDYLERNLLVPSESPTIRFLGSSRVALGIAPAEFDLCLNTKRGSSINLGLSGGGQPYSAAHMNNLADRYLAKADLVVVGIDGFSFSERFAVNQLFRESASWSQRIRYAPAPFSAVFDACFTFRWKLKPSMPYIKSFLGDTPVRSLNYAINSQRQLRRYDWIEEGKSGKTLTAKQAARVLTRHYLDYRLEPQSVNFLRDLLIELQRENKLVVVIRTPDHPLFFDQHLALYREEHDETTSVVTALCSDLEIPFLDFEDASSIGLASNDFYDSVHLDEEGSKKFSCILAETLLPTYQALGI